MREEIEKEVKLSEEEMKEINAGRRAARYRDGVAQVRHPQRHVEGDEPIKRTVNVERD